jgi:hypothetical protein
MFGVMQHLKITMCENADEAIEKGFDYKGKGIKAIEIAEVVVIKKGTQLGHPTVDLVMVDEYGTKYVVMLTGNLIKSIPC